MGIDLSKKCKYEREARNIKNKRYEDQTKYQ